MHTVIPDYNMKMQNTFRMNVSCKGWIEYTDASDLPGIIATLGDTDFIHIGQGSNMLFLGNYNGSVLHSRILTLETSPGENATTLVRAGAGISMDSLIEHTCGAGLWGLENLSGIPREVGASAVQNVGAYGVEAKDAIVSVDCYDTFERRFVTLSNSDCKFGYRDSLFKSAEFKGRYIVTHVTYRLSASGCPVLDYGHLNDCFDNVSTLTPSLVRNRILEIRSKKLPDVEKVGSAGSFFKNPVVDAETHADFVQRVKTVLGSDATAPAFKVGECYKLSAAWLIDRAGLKGYQIGNVATWHTQPLVIVNATGKASPEEVLQLENLIIERVRDTFGITLHPEVEHID